MRASLKLLFIQTLMLAVIAALFAIAMGFFPQVALENSNALFLTVAFFELPCVVLVIALSWVVYFSDSRIIPQRIFILFLIGVAFILLSIIGQASNGVFVPAGLSGSLLLLSLLSLYVLVDRSAEEKLDRFKRWKRQQDGETTPFVIEYRTKDKFESGVPDPEKDAFEKSLKREVSKQKRNLTNAIFASIIILVLAVLVSLLVYLFTPKGWRAQEMSQARIEAQEERDRLREYADSLESNRESLEYLKSFTWDGKEDAESALEGSEDGQKENSQEGGSDGEDVAP